GLYFLPASKDLGLDEMIRRSSPPAHCTARDSPGTLPCRTSESPTSHAIPRASGQALRRFVQPHRPAATVRDSLMLRLLLAFLLAFAVPLTLPAADVRVGAAAVE